MPTITNWRINTIAVLVYHQEYVTIPKVFLSLSLFAWCHHTLNETTVGTKKKKKKNRKGKRLERKEEGRRQIDDRRREAVGGGGEETVLENLQFELLCFKQKYLTCFPETSSVVGEDWWWKKYFLRQAGTCSIQSCCRVRLFCTSWVVRSRDLRRRREASFLSFLP